MPEIKLNLVALLKEAISETMGEYTDDMKLTVAEGVEILGQLLLAVSVQLGEDGQ